MINWSPRSALVAMVVLLTACGQKASISIEPIIFDEDVMTEEEKAAFERQERIDAMINADMNNLKDIYAIFRTWRNDRQRDWPQLPVPVGIKETEFPLVTAQIFEYLAGYSSVERDVFVSPSGPDLELLPPRDYDRICNDPDPRWAASYALDWSTPSNGDLNRIFMSTRHAIDGKIVVCYYDGGTDTVDVRPADDAQRRQFVTLDGHGKRVAFAADAPRNVTADVDDIFSNDGPGEGPVNATYGEGSRLRCWVK